MPRSVLYYTDTYYCIGTKMNFSLRSYVFIHATGVLFIIRLFSIIF